MKRPEPNPDAPISRIFSVEELDALPDGRLVLTATPEECAALAAANDLPGVSKVEARLRLVPEKRGFDVIGEVRARVTQTCVATLEDFESDFVEPVEVRFEPVAAPPRTKGRATPLRKEAEKPSVRKSAAEKAPPPAEEVGEDPPEPIIDGYADLGPVVAQFFSLGLDPYPRKPGAAFDPGALGAPMVEDEDPEENPFAALAGLKKNADKA